MDGIAAADLYERDFYAWTQDQAARLRAMAPRNDGVDAANVAEEIESLGKSDRRAAESLIGKLLLHLVKLQAHPDQASRSHWEREVDEFRRQIARIFRDSPSLRARRQEMAQEEWVALVRRARRDIGRVPPGEDAVAERLAATAELPFDLDTEVLDEDWFPSAA